MPERPLLLDLYCKAGGAARGYQDAGFYVVGVDIERQPRYAGDAFVQADALEVLQSLLDGDTVGGYALSDFDGIHASPPCQAFTALKSMWNSKKHLDLLTPTRALFEQTGKPWVIENVEGAKSIMRSPVMLCGSMFGLGTGEAELRRHRLFELSGFSLLTPRCQHYTRHLVIGVYGGHGRDRRRTVGVYGDGNGRDYRKDPVRPNTVGVWGSAGGTSVRDGTQQFSTAERAEAMGIDWMTGDQLSQAIPPAYIEFIGRALMASLAVRNA